MLTPFVAKNTSDLKETVERYTADQASINRRDMKPVDPATEARLLAEVSKHVDTLEELIAIAEKEYAFSSSEAKKASREMGFGDDW